MPSEYEKFYKILDLDVGASKEEVKKSFRELSHIWHPDNHAGKSPEVQNRSNEKFKEISNAYEVLGKYLEEQGREIDEKKGERKKNLEKKPKKTGEIKKNKIGKMPRKLDEKKKKKKESNGKN